MNDLAISQFLTKEAYMEARISQLEAFLAEEKREHAKDLQEKARCWQVDRGALIERVRELEALSAQWKDLFHGARDAVKEDLEAHAESLANIESDKEGWKKLYYEQKEIWHKCERVTVLEVALKEIANYCFTSGLDASEELQAVRDFAALMSRQAPEPESPLTGLLAEIDRAKAPAQETQTTYPEHTPYCKPTLHGSDCIDDCPIRIAEKCRFEAKALVE